MQNVSVFEVNSGIGTISDNLGFYKLLLKSDSVCLQISNTGFDVVTESFELVCDTVLPVYLFPEKSVKEIAHEKLSDIHANIKMEKKVSFMSDNKSVKENK